VRHSETLEPLVLYRALYSEQGLWVPPHAMFFEAVVVDGVERFVDAAAVDASTFSLICPAEGRSSQEVGLSPTGLPGEIAVHMAAGVASLRLRTGAASRFGRGAGAAQAAGTQQVLEFTAPLPDEFAAGLQLLRGL
jgi:hypothetical protein